MKAAKNARRVADKVRRGVGPISRLCVRRDYSVCATADLHALDWSNWFQDSGFGDGCYIHVRLEEPDDVTWHRVYPKKIKGRIVTRVAFHDGKLHWLHDKANNKSSVSGASPEYADSAGSVSESGKP